MSELQLNRQCPEFVLHVGNLSSIASFHFAIAEQLHAYNEQYKAGARPRVRLNLMNIQPRKINMSALTSLLAILDRLREFCDAPFELDVRWNPDVFGFLTDIGFFDRANERDLINWPEGIADGYRTGRTNPNTQILFFERSFEFQLGSSELAAQKDEVRNTVKEDLLIYCGELFRSRRNARPIPNSLRDQVAVTSAELVVNAHLWGRSHAFVGLQRTPYGITVCVCDNGVGFHSSMSNRRKNRYGYTPDGHLEALAVASIVNDEDFGLRRAIDMVTRFGGHVEMSSYAADIVWKNILWRYWTDVAIAVTEGDSGSLIDGFSYLKSQYRSGQSVVDEKQSGAYREWKHPLRGARVVFFVPIQ